MAQTMKTALRPDRNLLSEPEVVHRTKHGESVISPFNHPFEYDAKK